MTNEQVARLTDNLWVKFATNDNQSGEASVRFEAFKLAIRQACAVTVIIEGTVTRSLSPCEVL